MVPLKQHDLCGVWVTVMLPINEDESIDWIRVADEIDYLLGSGVQGVYTNGTAAEFWTLSEHEFDRLHDLLTDRCEKAQVPFQIGVSDTSPQTSLARLQRSIQWKPGAVQLILPDWYPISDEEAVAFLSRMAEAAVPIGLVLYNPPHAKRVLAPSSWGYLSRAVPELMGIKVVDGDKEWYELMAAHAPNLSIFVPGHRLATGIGFGAAGSYSNVGCLNPIGAQRWYQQMSAHPTEALELEGRIQQFFNQHIPPSFPDPAKDKLLAAIGGWANIGTRLRWPYRWISENVAHDLRRIASREIPEIMEFRE